MCSVFLVEDAHIFSEELCTETVCFDMVQNGMSIQISQDYSSMVNFVSVWVRMFSVVPIRFPGMANCSMSYQLWIDNDIVFNTEKFWQLCDLAVPGPDKDGNDQEEREIAAGWYATEDGHTTNGVAHWLDEEDFRKNGGVMNHETCETMQKRRKAPSPWTTLVLDGS